MGEEIKAKVIEIKRFAVHDGDGIRTTVFLKGCPLKCVWCHNPESISFDTQLAYYENKYVSCGFVQKDAIDKVLPNTDIFLYDLKAYDEDVHLKCTGQSNKLILENLKYIDGCGKSIEVRIPYVSGYNDNQIKR